MREKYEIYTMYCEGKCRGFKGVKKLSFVLCFFRLSFLLTKTHKNDIIPQFFSTLAFWKLQSCGEMVVPPLLYGI